MSTKGYCCRKIADVAVVGDVIAAVEVAVVAGGSNAVGIETCLHFELEGKIGTSYGHLVGCLKKTERVGP